MGIHECFTEGSGDGYLIYLEYKTPRICQCDCNMFMAYGYGLLCGSEVYGVLGGMALWWCSMLVEGYVVWWGELVCGVVGLGMELNWSLCGMNLEG